MEDAFSRLRLLSGVVLTVVLGPELDRWDMADAAVQPDGVEPMHSGQGRELEVVDAASWAFVSDQLGLEQPDQVFGLAVVVGVTDGV